PRRLRGTRVRGRRQPRRGGHAAVTSDGSSIRRARPARQRASAWSIHSRFPNSANPSKYGESRHLTASLRAALPEQGVMRRRREAHRLHSKPVVAKSIRIMLADDHAVVRQGLRAVLSGEADFKIVGEAADGRETLRVVAEHLPDVLVLDHRMPVLDGI